MNLHASPDRTLIRAAGDSVRFVRVDIEAPRPEHSREREPINVSFVLDRSGSMAGEKIDLARRAVDHALSLLDERDRFSIVVFDNEVDLVAASALAAPSATAAALERLARIDSRGSTDLASGWLRGCEQVAEHLGQDAVGRVLLLTDGLANQGVTDQDELAHRASELRSRGVRTSAFGVGNDFDEVLLGRLADAGAGRYYYIQRAGDIPDRVASEIGEELEVMMPGARLAARPGPGVGVELLNELPTETRDDALVSDLGDLVGGQRLSLVFRVRFPAGEVGQHLGVRYDLGGTSGREVTSFVEWTFGDHAANDAQSRDGDVDEAVGLVFAARARREALERNRRGDWNGARRVLRQTRERIGTYAGSDPVLAQVLSQLAAEADLMAAPLSAAAAKEAHSGVYQSLRSRAVSGKSDRS